MEDCIKLLLKDVWTCNSMIIWILFPIFLDLSVFKNIKVFDCEIELWCSLWKERKIEKEALQQLDLTDVLKEAGDFFPQIQKAYYYSYFTMYNYSCHHRKNIFYFK